MTQYYIIELQKYLDGSFGDVKHVAWDEDPTKARLKAESKFYEVLAAAAVSELPVHAAIMFTSEGVPIMNQRYIHVIPQPEPEPDEGEEPEEPVDGGEDGGENTPDSGNEE